MKKLLCMLLALAMLPALSGCGSIYSNYQQLESLLVIQAMGIDKTPAGVDITLASAPNSARGESPAILSGGGESISQALERIKIRSNEQALFYSHIRSIVIGDETARAGIEDYLSYICRSPYVRVNLPIYIMKNSSAKEVMESAGSSSTGISELLLAIEENLGSGGGERVVSAAEILRDDRRFGSALICALELGEASDSRESEESTSGEDAGSPGQEQSSPEDSGSDEAPLTAAVAGYAIIKDGHLCGFIDREKAVGVGFIKNHVDISPVVVRDQQGRPVTLEISNGGAEIEPLWADDGSLLGIDVSANVRAAITETSAGDAVGTPQYTDFITSRLESEISRRISAVLQQSRELQADFLGLAGIIELAAPEKFSAMPRSFVACLPELELQITVSGTLSHTNDIKDA